MLVGAGVKINEEHPRGGDSALAVAIKRDNELMVETLQYNGANTCKFLDSGPRCKKSSVGILRELENHYLELTKYTLESSLMLTILQAKAIKCRNFIIGIIDDHGSRWFDNTRNGRTTNDPGKFPNGYRHHTQLTSGIPPKDPKEKEKRSNTATLFVFFMQIVANETKKKKLRAQRWWTNTNG